MALGGATGAIPLDNILSDLASSVLALLPGMQQQFRHEMAQYSLNIHEIHFQYSLYQIYCDINRLGAKAAQGICV